MIPAGMPLPAGKRRPLRRPVSACLVIGAALLFLAPPPAAALEVGGFLKGAAFALDGVSRLDPELSDDYLLLATRARLEVKHDQGMVHLEAAAEARLAVFPRELTGAGAVAFGGQFEEGLLDLSQEFLRRGDTSGTISLDRLFAELDGEKLKLLVGRQPIGFGTSLFWAPTDMVSPFSPEELDREVRPGTDAVRLLWSPGRLAEIGALWAPGRDFEGNTSLAHARFPLGLAEATLVAGLVRERLVLGGSLAGEAGGMGLRTEARVLEARRTLAGAEERTAHAAVTGGFDYRFGTGIYLSAEYLYNGAGSPRREDYGSLAGEEPFSLGLDPFLGRHYLLARVAKQLHPLVEGSLTGYGNLSDASLLLWPQVSLSLADNTEGVIFLRWPVGPAGTEFGSMPRQAGAWVTVHF